MNEPTRKILAEVLKVDTIGIRAATDDDLGFVLDTFGRTLRAEYPDMRTSDFAGWIRAHLNRLLTVEGSAILVAHDGDAPEVLRGWVMFGADGRLDYVFVRNEYRGFGLARRLLAAAAIDTSREVVVTHMTKAGRRLKARHPVRYVPLA